MASPFRNVRFHATESDQDELLSLGSRPRGLRGGAAHLGAIGETFDNDEAAARFYLTRVFARHDSSTVRGMAAVDQPQAVPDMRVVHTQESPLTATRLVTFEQTQTSIPIFGSIARIEMDKKRRLVAVDAEVTDVPDVAPVASISPADALQRIAAFTGVDASALVAVTPPELTYYHDDNKDSWHLAYFFRNVPAAPTEFTTEVAEGRGHGLGRSPRELRPRLHYLIDAHNGDVLRYYSAAPTLTVPGKIRGTDEEDREQEFFGRQVDGGFELYDPLRAIKTHDLGLADLDANAFPADPIRGQSGNFGAVVKAAISAHVNAMRVHDFYKSVLQRDGIDDKGMDLVSVVNCTYAADEPPPQWHNAVWYDNRMWYGQIQEGDGLRSFSRFLDVIAHELTHGVTQYTSNLVYQDQSGALNESFSDIFGVIINNWYRVGPDSDVGAWNWEIGAGLGDAGKPLRDLSDPTRTGDPDHMDQYLVTTRDSCGVHTNSNIHNKAAYNLLTAADDQGQRVFPAREVAILYYLTLSRLNPLATFPKTLQVLLDVADTLYAGDMAERDKKRAHVAQAYEKVGITEA
jgi:bacillolysin